ncbi:hypothetical protein ACLOAV_002924 [Pseudogymnoascus australis]
MRFNIFLWMIFLSIEVNANDLAFPFEMLFFYYSYKAEFTALPQGSRTIGKGCQHVTAGADIEASMVAQGVAGICTFNEFVKEVLNKKHLSFYTHDGNDALIDYPSGRTIDPDHNVVGNFARKTNWLYNTAALLDKYRGKPPPAQATVFRDITDNIQTARRNAVTPSKLTSSLASIVAYTKVATQYRIGAQALLQVAPLRLFPKWSPYIHIPTADILGPDGSKIGDYQFFDSTKTIDAAGDTVSEQDKTDLKDWSINYPASDQPTINHMSVIYGGQDTITRVSSSDTSC